jgi:hypothetical protein
MSTAAAFIIMLITVLMTTPALADGPTIRDVPKEDFDARFTEDARMLHAYTRRMDAVLADIKGESALFSRGRTEDFTIPERARLYAHWATYLDHMMALEAVNNFYSDFFFIIDRPRHVRVFLLAYASYLAKVSYGLDFVALTIGNDLYEKKLDDAAPEHGIPAGMYATLKWNAIHVNRLTGVHAGYAYYSMLKSTFEKEGLTAAPQTAWLLDYIDRHYARIKRELDERGVEYFASNGADIVRDSAMAAWFPVQMGVSQWMGSTRVMRGHKYFITHEQLAEMDRHLRPGDIILERRNWYLSNVGLPGFWPHAELYIGSPDELAAFFDDEAVTAHYRARGDFTGFVDYLEKTYPAEMAGFRRNGPDGFEHQIIEAVAEGVKFSTLEEAASADYIGVMRPKLGKLDIALAVEQAFGFLGRAYDFDFDFLTDSTLVCSEVIYKAYLPGKGKRGIGFELSEVAGRKVLSPNSIARKLDEEYGTEAAELEFVYFLEGSEEEGIAHVRGEGAMRSSHRRPKWDVAQP